MDACPSRPLIARRAGLLPDPPVSLQPSNLHLVLLHSLPEQTTPALPPPSPDFLLFPLPPFSGGGMTGSISACAGMPSRRAFLTSGTTWHCPPKSDNRAFRRDLGKRDELWQTLQRHHVEKRFRVVEAQKSHAHTLYPIAAPLASVFLPAPSRQSPNALQWS
jgi:hypothetical protein